MAAERRRRREPRPKADKATIISTVLALAALGWAVYAYFYPRPAPSEPVIAKPPAVASPWSSTSAPTATTVNHPASTSKPSGMVATVKSWWHSFNNRLERERHGVSWWQLALAWCVLIGFFFYINRDDDHQIFFGTCLA